MIHGSASIDMAAAIYFASLGIQFSVLFEDLPEEAIIKRIKIFKPDIFLTRIGKENFMK